MTYIHVVLRCPGLFNPSIDLEKQNNKKVCVEQQPEL